MSAIASRWADTDDVVRLARGKWFTILHAECQELHEALSKPGRHVDCPLHGGKKDFRLRRDFEEEGRAHCSCGNFDGFHLLMQLNNYTFPEAVEAVRRIVAGPQADKIPVYRSYSRPSSTQRLKDDTRIKSTIQRWWNQSVPLDAPEAKAARLYFRNRKLGSVLMPLDDVGFHPALAYFDSDRKLIGEFPALISIIRMPDGRVSSVHRTYITHDGQKAFGGDEARKQYQSPSTNPVRGGAIRLDKEVGPILNLAEGLETALAVRALTGQPTWSTLNKELLRMVAIPEQVRLVVIWGDRDLSEGGQEAAIKLMDRIRESGKAAVVMLPPFNIPEGEKGVDWNDVVARLGLERTLQLPLLEQWQEGVSRYLQPA